MIGFLALAMATGTEPDPRCAARVDFYQPPRGIISTPRMAVEVARTYLEAIYGASVIARQLPLTVSRRREVWHVEGVMPRNSVGGVAEIDMCQSTGQVLRVVHGK
ncbi:MAG: NTF2 fold immunity protein [Pseudomonadota bacterium]